MPLTTSNMPPLNSKAFNFTLLDTVTDKFFSLNQLKSDKATLLMFICNHCPYVKHVNPELVKIAKEYQPKGVAFIAVSSNDAGSFPEDAPNKMKETAKNLGYTFPYLYDETQEVAHAYQAACTPDFFLFDKNMALVYRGQLDDSRPGNHLPLTGNDLRNALDNLLLDNPINPNQKPSMGCNIKWKP